MGPYSNRSPSLEFPNVPYLNRARFKKELFLEIPYSKLVQSKLSAAEISGMEGKAAMKFKRCLVHSAKSAACEY